MAVDIATLGIKVQSDDIPKASDRLKALQNEGGKAEQSTNKLSSSFDGLSRYIQAAQGAMAALGMGAFVKQALDAALAMERINSAMKASAGTALATAKELAFVREESQRLGLEFRSTAESYAKFSAASKGTSIEGEGVRKIFKGVSEAATAMRLTTEQSNGVFLALQQMMSKGTVQAEELRGQLAERLPGAFGMAAKAMGMTTQELGKQLELGNVLSSDLLPKLAEEMHRTYGTAAIEAATGGQAAINRFKNSVFESASALGGALMPAFTGILGVLTPLMDYLKMFIGGIEILAVKLATLPDKAAAAWRVIKSGEGLFTDKGMAMYGKESANSNAAAEAAIADIMAKYIPTSSAKTSSEMAAEQAKVAAALAKESAGAFGKATSSAHKKGLTDQQKEYQEQVKSFLEDSWENAAMQLAAEDFSGDVTKKLGLLSPQKTGFTKSPALSLGVDTQLKSLEQQKAPNNSAFDSLEMELKDPYSKKLAELNKYYTEKKAIIDGFEAQNAADEQRRADATIALDKQVADRRAEITEISWQAVGGILAGQLGQMAGMMDQANSDQFMAYKAMMMAQATIATAMAVAGVLAASSYLGPFAIPLAVAAGALGAAQIAIIAGQQMPARELGGPVTAGQPYIVGEKRAEVFVPNQSGRIIPSTGESQPVNVTQVYQISTGVADTVRSEIGRMVPALTAHAVNAVRSAMSQGQLQRA